MTTAPSQIGSYAVEAEIGRGGMGIVYRATDSRLGRTVAIKALPEHFADDPERLARFEREARTLATLNHPNVASIYGVEEHESRKYLVLEYVEGETLADRLDRGPLPVDEALEFCAQVAAGLEAAHEAGVIHRDLKPANIRITPEGKAKVLDFGLARTDETSSSGSSVSQMPTLTTPHSPTTPGAILGTAPYMSPEQARGRRVDKRSDVWSFGVVLYECLTGMSPFIGETATDSIGAILHKDVDLNRLPAETPRGVRHVIERCLERDRNERWRDIGDVRIEIDSARRSPGSTDIDTAATRRVNVGLVAVVAILFAVFGALAGVVLSKPELESKPIVRAVIEPAPQTTIVHVGDLAGPAVVSPDGSTVAFVARSKDGSREIWIRPLDSDDPLMLRSTGGASHPFWSRDSRSLGFFADGKLKRADLSTRSVRPICDAPAGRGGAWLDDGTIVFSPQFQSSLFRVDSAGGEATQVTTLDPTRHTSHRWPTPLPGGRFLYLAVSHDPGRFDEAALFIGAVSGGAPIEVMRSLFGGEVIGNTLLAVRDGVLNAFAIDLGTGAIVGEPAPIVTSVVSDLSTWYGNFSASNNGVLVYHRLVTDENATLAVSADADRVLYYSRDGRLAATVAEGVAQTGVSVSPDSRTVAISVAQGNAGSGNDIWLYPVPRGDRALDTNYETRERLTFMPGAEVNAVWSPDGSEIAFGKIFGPPPLGLYRKKIGGGREELILEAHVEDEQGVNDAAVRGMPGEGYDLYPLDWTDDGRFLIFGKGSWTSVANAGIWALPLDGGEPFLVVESDADEGDAKVSPNGRWIAFSSSTAMSNSEIYVEPFRPGWDGFDGEPPPEGARWRVSIAGGAVPRWSEDGTELSYITNEGTIIAVAVDTEQSMFIHNAGAPLFQVEFEAGMDYDVVSERTTSDHFLVNGIPNSGDTAVNVILNWRELLND